MRSVSRTRRVGLAAGVVLAAFAGLGLAWAESPRTVWSGVYTAGQVARGREAMAQGMCRTCHGETLQGATGVPSIVGGEFQFKWDGKSLAELFDKVRTDMPPGQGGSLGDQKYIDIIAVLLAEDGYPASEQQELPPDPAALAAIAITASK
jgi:mono/diheme cytochrome c family protein